MKVIIIEDEEISAIALKKLIIELKPDFEVDAIINSVTDAVKWFQTHKMPDLLFVDVKLSDDLCFSIFEQVNVTCPVIFTTAFDEFAIKAFEQDSIDYLLKPIKKEALYRSIDKFMRLHEKYVSNSLMHGKIESILKAFEAKQQEYRYRFLVQRGSNLIVINNDDIAYFYYEFRIVYLFTIQGERFVVNSTLDELEKQLDPQNYFRINRQFIISLKSIIKVKKQFSNRKLKVQVAPEAPKEIVVSTAKTPVFTKWLEGHFLE